MDYYKISDVIDNYGSEYRNRIIDFVDNVRAENINDSLFCLFKELKKWGIDCGMMANVITNDSHFINDQMFFAYSTYDKEFEREYEDNNGAFHDESVLWTKDRSLKWCPIKSHHMLWKDDISDEFRSPEAIHIDEISFKYGIRYGFSIPSLRVQTNIYGGYGCCSLATSQKEFMDDVYCNIELIVDLIQLFDEHITNKFSYYPILKKSNFYDNQVTLLTDKELALLKLLSEGNSYKEISFLLVLKDQTVRSNMRKIRDKLKCKNNQSAIQFYNSIIK